MHVHRGRREVKAVFAVLLLSVVSMAQSLNVGSVRDAMSNYAPHRGQISWDFDLHGGVDQCGVIDGPREFGYCDGKFTLNFKGGQCGGHCSFLGTVTTWYEPQSISGLCTIQSALVSGDLMIVDPKGNFHDHDNVTADFSQMHCISKSKNVQWWAGGTLTVHIAQ